jgi:hypothetical protein
MPVIALSCREKTTGDSDTDVRLLSAVASQFGCQNILKTFERDVWQNEISRFFMPETRTRVRT